MTTRFFAAVLILVLASAAAWAQPLGTAFTYQGRLEDAGGPVNGLHDLQFVLFGVPEGGARVAGPICAENVNVANGLFTVPLDFGAVFNGNERWLEIGVRADSTAGNCGTGAYTPLTPRQALTAAPYSLQTRGLYVDNFGRVGIGTSTPVALLNIDGGLILNDVLDEDVAFSTGNFYISNSDNEDPAYHYQSDPEQHEFFVGGGLSLKIASDGNVGIGTATPIARLHVQTASTNGAGLYGLATAATGGTFGAFFQSNSVAGIGVLGSANAGTGNAWGVYGQSLSTSGRGVSGFATAGTGVTNGVQGECNSTAGRGVYGRAHSDTGPNFGGYFESDSTGGRGVYGEASAGSGTNYGVFGRVTSPDGYAGYFLGGRNHFAGNVGIGTTMPEAKLHITGVSDTSPAGGGLLVVGATDGANVSFDNNEIMARDNAGVADLFLNHNGGNVLVSASGSGRVGIRTTTPSAPLDVNGSALIRDDLDVTGDILAGGVAARGIAASQGATFSSGQGILFAMQVFADEPDDIAIRAYGPANPSPVGYAAQFVNDIDVIGEVSKDGGSFKIDHPLDPANKYLKHSFVESPDMMNVYNGNVVTDERGYATVTLPEWFETLNRDFRYQLTTLDEADSETFAQAKVVRKIHGNQFTLRSSRPNCEVSWQITGIRQDAWANANRIQVEQDKVAGERGLYRHPELYDQPPEKALYHRTQQERAAMQASPGSAGR